MRKQKEIDPVLQVLTELEAATKKDKTADGKALHRTIHEIQAFTEQLGTLVDRVAGSPRGELLLKLLKFIA